MKEVNLGAFWVTSSDEIDMCCPTGECWGYISIGNGDTLADIRRKAAEHVAEKHAPVIDGDLAAARKALTTQ